MLSSQELTIMHASFGLTSRFLLSSILALGGAAVVGNFAMGQDAAAPAATSETAEAPAEGTADQPTGDQLLKEAEEALNAGDFPKALGIYDQMVKAGEQKAELNQFLPLFYTGRGRALAGLQEFEAADEDFKKILDTYPDYVPTLVARGLMYLETGRAEDALADFQKAAKTDRANLQAQFGLGKSYILLGGYDQGIGPLSKVLLADPNNAESYRLRGTGYAGTLKFAKAIEDLNKAIELNPQDYEAYFTLGTVYLREENYDASVAEFAKSIENYKPKPGQEEEPFTQGYLTKAAAEIERGKAAKDDATKQAAYKASVDASAALLKQSNEKSPAHAGIRAAALHSRGVGERMLGEDKKAIESFSEALELNPDLGETYLRRGICFHNLGEDKLAVADFAQASKISLGDPRANLWEGFMFAKEGDYYEAVRAYGDAISASDRYAPAYMNRGLAYLMLGENKKALHDFNEAIRLSPTNADYYFKRGVALERLGETDKASNSFASAIEHDDKHAAAYRHMADVMKRQGHGKLAQEYLDKAAELPAEDAKPGQKSPQPIE
jgi:tetratricopeptide (TPR) repeat protein